MCSLVCYSQETRLASVVDKNKPNALHYFADLVARARVIVYTVFHITIC